LVQLIRHLHSHRFFQVERQRMVYGTVALDFASALVEARLSAHLPPGF
jgi:hypothetical protein